MEEEESQSSLTQFLNEKGETPGPRSENRETGKETDEGTKGTEGVGVKQYIVWENVSDDVSFVTV